MGAWLWEQVSGFFSGIVDGVKDFLGINSPSKVFAGIGDNMGKGIGVGFSDAMNGIEKDMQNSIPTDFDINGNITESISGGSKSSGYTVNHTGTIRVEGINDSGMMAHVVDIVIGELR